MKGWDKVQAFGAGYPRRFVLRLVKVVTKFDHVRAKCGDRRILVRGVSSRHIDCCGNPSARSGKCDRLTMIAARRCYDTGSLRIGTTEPIEVDDPPANL